MDFRQLLIHHGRNSVKAGRGSLAAWLRVGGAWARLPQKRLEPSKAGERGLATEAEPPGAARPSSHGSG